MPLLVAVRDSTPGEVVWGELNLNLVARKNADVVHTHLSGDVRQNFVAILELDAEHGVRQRLDNGAFEHYGVFFRLGQGGLLNSGGRNDSDDDCVRADFVRAELQCYRRRIGTPSPNRQFRDRNRTKPSASEWGYARHTEPLVGNHIRLRKAPGTSQMWAVKNYEPAMSFDAEHASVYDVVSHRGDEHDAVTFLERVAEGGSALELAIGTGRIALPLAARGITVDGIDISEAMVEQLRAKPGGDRIAVTIGDFADVNVVGTYGLIYVVYNTLFNLLTQDAQVRCFQNVAARLTDTGVFVVEAFVPNWLYRLRNDQYVDAEAIGVRTVRLDVGRHDPVGQVLDESHVTLSARGITVNPIVCRYAWPSELDLMARLAGLRLKHRWGGWNGEPFVASSELHVSVYGR